MYRTQRLDSFDTFMGVSAHLDSGKLRLSEIDDRTYQVVMALAHAKADLAHEAAERNEMMEQLFGAPKSPRRF